MIHVRIADLKDGLHEVELAPAPADLELDPDAFRDIHVTLHLDRRNDKIFVMLEADALATLECDRTLDLFEQSVQGAYSILYAPPSFAKSDPDDYEEVRPLHPADQEIDLTDAVRDTLLLALPQRRVAPWAGEIELETQFGDAGDEAIDPRWEALRKLKEDDNTSHSESE